MIMNALMSVPMLLLFLALSQTVVPTMGFVSPIQQLNWVEHKESLQLQLHDEQQPVNNDNAKLSRRSILTSSFTGGILASLSIPILLLGTTTPAFAAAKDLKEDYRQGTAALADMDSSAPVPREAYKKLESGVIVADLFKGKAGADNTIIKQGSKVNLEWVLRKSNGYFVDSSEVVGTPFIFTVGDGTAIKGVDRGVVGMAQGGVRRLLIPPSLAYVDGLDDGKPGPMPQGFGPRQQMRRVQLRADVPGEYIYLEVQVTRVR